VPRPRVLSLAFAVPELHYTQEEVFAALGYPHPFWKVFAGLGIDKRYFCIPVDRLMELGFQEQQDEYARQAPRLAEQALRLCLDDRPATDIRCLIYGSCTGFMPGPTVPHYLQRSMGLAPSTYYNNNVSMGCESAYPGLKRAADFVEAHGGMAAVVNVELSSLTYYPEPAGRPDPENGYELLRATAIFADAAVAALVGFDNDWRHPELVDSETFTNPDYIDDLGYTWRGGRLRVRLSRRVPDLAPLVVKPAVDTLLHRAKLPLSAIKWFVVHAAGNNVLDKVRDALGIPEEKMTLSRETLRQFGNTSSTSVGITGKRLMNKFVLPGDWVLMISVGPGMSGGASLFHFSEPS
jgi:predicted naringenin-chalcone synthase